MDAMTHDGVADSGHADDHRATRELPGPARWIVVSRPREDDMAPVRSPGRLVAVVAAGAVLVLVVAAVVGVLAARKLAERQAVNDAANTADLLAEAVVQPVVTDSLATGDATAAQTLDDALQDYLAHSSLVRVKVWTRDGVIVYSDEPRLLGQRYQLSADAREVFSHPSTRAEVSDLDKPENQYERGQGRLLEAYRPIWTPSGTPLLFETYSPYTEVDARAGQLWRGFAGVTISSLLLFAALLLPLLWQLLTRLRAAQRQREGLLERAVEASDDERRRIAGALHDGVVQELAATSFSIAGAAARAESSGDPALAEDLTTAAATLRDSIGGLRTLLVDIYPATLESAGLLDVLRDLAGTLRARDIEVDLDAPRRRSRSRSRRRPAGLPDRPRVPGERTPARSSLAGVDPAGAGARRGGARGGRRRCRVRRGGDVRAVRRRATSGSGCSPIWHRRQVPTWPSRRVPAPAADGA